MTSKQKVEVAIRAGLIAKEVLGVTDTDSAVVARMQLLRALSQMTTLDGMLSDIANHRITADQTA